MPTYAFVDSIGASPTVVLNLDDQNPLSVMPGTRTAPPTRRVSSYGSSARDGDVVAQESYNDRSITIPLSFKEGTSAEVQATTIQALGRLLDGPQWLKWQHDGATAPVFFRTRYGDMDVDDEITSVTPTRYVTLNLVAEPFAYGLPESGLAVAIASDPTGGTNPMSYVFPTVKGDVATPLSLKFAQPATGTVDNCLLASCASPSAPTTPIRTGTCSATAASGWAFASATADSTAIGGTTNTFTKSSGTDPQVAVFTLSSVPPGDYRVLARIKTTVTGPVGMNITAVTETLASLDAPGTTIEVDGNSWYWRDFGVMRLPVQQQNSVPPGIAPISAGSVGIDLIMSIPATTGVVSIDDLLAIPAGLDDARGSSLLIAQGGSGAIPHPFVVDGDSGQAWGRSSNADPNAPVPFAGSAASLTPGTTNVMTLVRSLHDVDVKTDSTSFDWLYYPKYLYVRPATT